MLFLIFSLFSRSIIKYLMLVLKVPPQNRKGIMSPNDLHLTALSNYQRIFKGYLPCINLPQMTPKECPNFSPLKVLRFKMLEVLR